MSDIEYGMKKNIVKKFLLSCQTTPTPINFPKIKFRGFKGQLNAKISEKRQNNISK